MRHQKRYVVLLCLLVLWPFTLSSSHAQVEERCFAETGFCISGAIRAYWERNGGLAVFGLPISPLRFETIEDWTGLVQWFERDRLEDRTAQGQGVLAGRLGVEYLDHIGTPWEWGDVTEAGPGCLAFPEQSGHQICGAFAAYWQRNGGLERFGVPITGEFETMVEDQPRTVQYFERRRIERHPDNAPPFDILIGLLGRELYEEQLANQPVPEPVPPGAVPHPGGVCATNAPEPVQGAQAWMTVPEPPLLTDTTLCVRLILDNQAIEGAEARAIARYRTVTTEVGPATTGPDGVAAISFNISTATPGFTVVMSAQVIHDGQTYMAETSFTPPRL